jgi:hypothetical protein
MDSCLIEREHLLQMQSGQRKPDRIPQVSTGRQSPLLPSTFSFARTDEGKAMYPGYPVFSAWRERMEALPTVRRFRAAELPYGPIEHARKWAVSHRPKY